VLRGNIANSAIIKQTAVQEEMMVHRGPARVFYSEKDLLEAIGEGTIKEGDVVVLPFQGPAGAPGMPEMLTPTDAIKGAGYKRVALLTDGRFSGATTGPCIGHVEMEAYNGGAIGAVRAPSWARTGKDFPGRIATVDNTWGTYGGLQKGISTRGPDYSYRWKSGGTIQGIHCTCIVMSFRRLCESCRFVPVHRHCSHRRRFRAGLS